MPVNIICQRCRTVNGPQATSCEQCGARFCPHCFLVIDSSTASVCPHCGKKDIHFKPGKYVPSAGVMDTGHCNNCGSRIPPGTKKCPYCGKLGGLVTQSPAQGYGMIQPAHEDTYQPPQQQEVCAKCGRPIPPGSSLCPVHGKYGGGSSLKDSGPLIPGRHTGDLWRKIEEKRAASAAEQGMVPHTRMTAPQDIYPQMGAAQMPPQEATEPYYEEEQRICPACGTSVPNRSKVCPNCGCNRLPPERSKPIVRAQDYYKAKQAVIEPIAGYGYPEAPPYYGQPAEQPYEPVYAPDFADYPEPKSKKKPKKIKEKARKENTRPEEEYGKRPQQKKFPLMLLLSILGLGGILVLGATYIMDQLNAPTQPVISPSSTTSISKAPVISGVQYSDVTRTSAIVSWTTDKKSSSIVVYCLNGGDLCETAKDDALVTSHSVKLTNLDTGAAYHITVKSRLDDDPDSPDASKEQTEVLRTLETPDTVPPVISDVKVSNLLSSGNSSTAEITWKTDEDSTSQVSYGTSNMLGSLQPSQTDTNLMPFHDQQLYGLPPETTIHFKVISRDANGNESSSPVKTFTTPPPGGSTIGSMAPDFTLSCADGSTVTLSELRGKKVIINFWHINCSPCVGELPSVQQYHTDNPDQALLVIHGTALGAVGDIQVGSFLQDHEYTFTVPLDGSGQVSALYNVTSVPRTFFLDSSGVIRKIKDGSFSGISEISTMLASY